MRVYGKAVLFENDIYFGCFNGKLYKLENSNGKLEQVFQTHGSKRNYHLVYKENDDFEPILKSMEKICKVLKKQFLN